MAAVNSGRHGIARAADTRLTYLAFLILSKGDRKEAASAASDADRAVGEILRETRTAPRPRRQLGLRDRLPRRLLREPAPDRQAGQSPRSVLIRQPQSLPAGVGKDPTPANPPRGRRRPHRPGRPKPSPTRSGPLSGPVRPAHPQTCHTRQVMPRIPGAGLRDLPSTTCGEGRPGRCRGRCARSGRLRAERRPSWWAAVAAPHHGVGRRTTNRPLRSSPTRPDQDPAHRPGETCVCVPLLPPPPAPWR